MIKSCLYIIIYKFILDYIYSWWIVENFKSVGFFLEFNLINYIVGWGVAVLLTILLIIKKRAKTHLLLTVIFLLLGIPMLTLFSFRSESWEHCVKFVAPFLFIVLFQDVGRFRFKMLKGGGQLSIFLSLVLLVVVFIHYIISVGISNASFTFADVYILRAKYGAISDVGLFSYVNIWAAKICNILLISHFLRKKRYVLSLIFIVAQVLLFAFSGHKSTLFVPFLIALFYAIDIYRSSFNVLVMSFIGFLLFMILYISLSNDLLIPSILLRRAFFVPANLNYVYFDFFTTSPFVIWSNGILSGLLTYPYNDTITHEIGASLGAIGMGANTGLFGSGYMQLGNIGIAIYTLLITIIINFINSFNRLENWMFNSLFFMPFMSVFLNSDLLTALLTHGLLLTILIIFLYYASYRRTQIAI